MTGIANSLGVFADRSTEVGEVVVLSDLLDDGVEPGLSALRRRGFDVTVLRVRCEADESPRLPADGATVVDAETGERLRVALTARDRSRYDDRRRVERLRAETFCAGAGIGFANLSAETPLGDLVFRELRGAGLVN